MLNSVQLYSRMSLTHILNSAILILEMVKFLRIKLIILRAYAVMNLACSKKLRLGEHLTFGSVTLFEVSVDPKLIASHLEDQKGMSHCLLQVSKHARSSWRDFVFLWFQGLNIGP